MRDLLTKGQEGAAVTGTHAVLLDTNMLVSMISEDPREHPAQDQIKIATLICDQFYVSDATLAEFELVLKHVNGVKEPSSFKASHQFKRLFTGDRFTLIEIGSLLDGRAEHFHAALRELEALAGSIHNRHRLLVHDALLMVASATTGMPILTMDRKIHRLAPKRIFEMPAPLPFDVEALRDVPLTEAFDLSSPLRKIYRQAIERFQAESKALAQAVSTAEHIEHELSSFRENARGQGAEMDRLREQLLDVMQSEQFWRRAAKPDSRATLAWTLVEMAVGLLPFPVPTTPLSYFVEARRHSARERNWPPPMTTGKVD